MLGFRPLPLLHFPSKFKSLPQILHLYNPNSSSRLNLKPRPPILNNRKQFYVYAENGNNGNNKKDKNDELPTANNSNSEEGKGNGKVKNELPKFNLKWTDLVLDPNPDNIVAVGLTGLLTWASVQVLWQLFVISAAILLAALKYTLVAALLIVILITLL